MTKWLQAVAEAERKLHKHVSFLAYVADAAGLEAIAATLWGLRHGATQAKAEGLRQWACEARASKHLAAPRLRSMILDSAADAVFDYAKVIHGSIP